MINWILAKLDMCLIWVLAKLDKHRIKLYRGYDYNDNDRGWAE